MGETTVVIQSDSPESLSAVASLIFQVSKTEQNSKIIDVLSELSEDGQLCLDVRLKCTSGSPRGTLLGRARRIMEQFKQTKDVPTKGAEAHEAKRRKRRRRWAGQETQEDKDIQTTAEPPERIEPRDSTDGGPMGVFVSPLFRYSPQGAEAMAREIGGNFAVLAGSTARKVGSPSWTTCRVLRDQLVSDGSLEDEGDHYIFKRNVRFDSPTAAAAIIRAGNVNGRRAWRSQDTGETYGYWFEQIQIARLRAAQASRDRDQQHQGCA